MRVDSASRLIHVSPSAIYQAFAQPGAMEQWLPPENMTGKMLHFDFRTGGSYRMRLTYKDPHDRSGKMSADADETEVQLISLEPGKCIFLQV